MKFSRGPSLNFSQGCCKCGAAPGETSHASREWDVCPECLRDNRTTAPHEPGNPPEDPGPWQLVSELVRSGHRVYEPLPWPPEASCHMDGAGVRETDIAAYLQALGERQKRFEDWVRFEVTEAIASEIAELSERVERLEVKRRQEFEVGDIDFVAIVSRLAGLSERLERLEVRVTGLAGKIEDLDQRTDARVARQVVEWEKEDLIDAEPGGMA